MLWRYALWVMNGYGVDPTDGFDEEQYNNAMPHVTSRHVMSYDVT